MIILVGNGLSLLGVFIVGFCGHPTALCALISLIEVVIFTITWAADFVVVILIAMVLVEEHHWWGCVFGCALLRSWSIIIGAL